MAKLVRIVDRVFNLDNLVETPLIPPGADQAEDAALRVDTVSGVIWLYGDEARVMRAYLRSEAENVLRTLRRRGVEGFVDTTPTEGQ